MEITRVRSVGALILHLSILLVKTEANNVQVHSLLVGNGQKMTEGSPPTTHDSTTPTALVTEPSNANTNNAPTAQSTEVFMWIFIGLLVFVSLGGIVKVSLLIVKKYKVSPPSRPRRAAEPLDVLYEGAIDPVMSPAVDEFDVEGAPIAQKGKFDKNSQDVRLKHRQYMQFMKRQEKSDADSRKFKKQPPIFIPAVVDDAQFAKKCEDPDNIILDNVVYDPSGNELYEIGSDVDNIELNPSSILTLTEDSQKASTMKTMKAPKTPVTSATQLKTAQPAKSMANAKSSKKSARNPKLAQQPQQQPQAQAPAKSLVEKSFLV